MAQNLKFTNNAWGTLASGINASDVAIALTAGQGARFPTLTAGQFFYGTLSTAANVLEIVKVTARSTDALTIVRAQDSSTASAFSLGDRFELRPCAALFDAMAQSNAPEFVSPITIDSVVLAPSIAELNYVDGVTSAIQTQLDAKAGITSPTIATPTFTGLATFSSATPAAAGSGQATFTQLAAQVNGVTAADGTKGVALPAAAAGQAILVINTSATQNLKVSPINAGDDQINSLTAGTGVFTMGPAREAWFVPTSATQWYVTDDAAIPSTPTEIGYTDGVTSAIQTQLGTKLNAASPAFTGTLSGPAAAFSAAVTVGTTLHATTYLYSYSHIYAQGEVYAYYSDMRLKDVVGNIDNALAKLKSLDTFTYKQNALADSLMGPDDRTKVGVSAQQVQAVLPEAVAPAPFDKDNASGEQYLTVQYEKLVPLLIAGVNELQTEVARLRMIVKVK